MNQRQCIHEECTCMPGFHNRYTGMPGLNSYSMPGSATCDTGHKGLCPVSPGGISISYHPFLFFQTEPGHYSRVQPQRSGACVTTRASILLI